MTAAILLNVSLAIVNIQAIQTAMTNPVKALKSEFGEGRVNNSSEIVAAETRRLGEMQDLCQPPCL